MFQELVVEDFREELDKKFLDEAIQTVLDTLTEREKQVIILRFWEEMTYERAGKEFNVTRERVRQIEAKALRKLRNPVRTAMLEKMGVPIALKWKEEREKNRLLEEKLREEEVAKWRRAQEEATAEQERQRQATLQYLRAKAQAELEADVRQDRVRGELRKEWDQTDHYWKYRPRPDYVILAKNAFGQYYLEIPVEHLHGFVPIKMETYNQWLKEMLDERDSSN